MAVIKRKWPVSDLDELGCVRQCAGGLCNSLDFGGLCLGHGRDFGMRGVVGWASIQGLSVRVILPGHVGHLSSSVALHATGQCHSPVRPGQ